MVPSSPKRPCSALNTTSGARVEGGDHGAAGRSPTTTGRTSNPASRKAAITCAPLARLTSRSAEMPP